MVAANIFKELFQEEEAYVREKKRGAWDFIFYASEGLPMITLVAGELSWGEKSPFTIHVPAPISPAPSKYTANAYLEDPDEHRTKASSLL